MFYWIGDGAGLSSFAVLWTLWIWEENPNYGFASSDVWTWRREGIDLEIMVWKTGCENLGF